MSIAKNIAKHFRDIHFGGNWTVSNLKDNLAGITWQQATQKVHNCTTIATLTYHSAYYVAVLLEVLKGNPLNGKDEHSSVRNMLGWVLGLIGLMNLISVYLFWEIILVTKKVISMYYR